MNSINDPRLKRDKGGRYIKRLPDEEIYNFNSSGYSINRLSRMFECSPASIKNAINRFKRKKWDE